MVLSIVLFSCNSTKKSSEKKSLLKSQEVTEYTIIKIDGLEEIAKNPTFKLDLIKNAVSGSTSCNHYGGNVLIEENKMKFDRIMATKMYCKEFAKIERAFTKNLALVTHYELKENQILLFDKADKLVLVGEVMQ